MLGVHPGGLSRRDAEEARRELIDVPQEATTAGVDLPGLIRIRVVEAVRVPPIGWNLGDGVHALGQHAPVPGRVDGTTREPASDADDGDALVPRPLMSIELRLRLLELQEGTLHQVPVVRIASRC